MNKHRKGLYIISGLFYLFFSGALALYPTKMTVGATISMIAGAVLTLAAAVSSFILAAQSGKNPKDSAVRTVVMPICFVGFAVILAADIINTAVHFETAFDAVRIIAELIGAAGHIAAAVIMFKNNMVFIRRNKIAYAVFAAMTGNPASIFVSGAFARERADGECKKLRKAGVIELIVGALIIVAAYIITNLTNDIFIFATWWFRWAGWGYRLAVPLPDSRYRYGSCTHRRLDSERQKEKGEEKIKLCGIKFQARKIYRLS